EHDLTRDGPVGARAGRGAERDHAVEGPVVDGNDLRRVTTEHEATAVVHAAQRQAGRPDELEQRRLPERLGAQGVVTTGSGHADGSTTSKRRPVISTGSMRTKRCFGAACHGNRGSSSASSSSSIAVISTAWPLTMTLHASPRSASKPSTSKATPRPSTD